MSANLAGAQSAQQQKPNIVFILMDTLVGESLACTACGFCAAHRPRESTSWRQKDAPA
jgi:hypothetical protein